MPPSSFAPAATLHYAFLFVQRTDQQVPILIPQHGTLEISRSHFRHNTALLHRQAGEATALCATVKANAYGHGAAQMTQLLRESGVTWLTFYSMEEAIGLRETTRQMSVLVLAPLVISDLMEDHEIALLDGTNLRVTVTG